MVAGSVGQRLAATAGDGAQRSVALRQPAGSLGPSDNLPQVPDAAQPEHAHWLREVSVSDLPLVDRIGMDAQRLGDLRGPREMLGSPHGASLGASHRSGRTYPRANRDA